MYMFNRSILDMTCAYIRVSCMFLILKNIHLIQNINYLVFCNGFQFTLEIISSIILRKDKVYIYKIHSF